MGIEYYLADRVSLTAFYEFLIAIGVQSIGVGAAGDLTTTTFGFGTQAGGQLMLTTEVENFPGFPEGILGPELMDRLREQAKRFGARVKFEAVTRVDVAAQPIVVVHGDQPPGDVVA